jgi:hypothetical protein
MKRSILSRKFTGLLVIPFILLLSCFAACTGKSNAEDDTFRQSIIDDPVKAQDQNEAAKLGKRKLNSDSTEADTTGK